MQATFRLSELSEENVLQRVMEMVGKTCSFLSKAGFSAIGASLENVDSLELPESYVELMPEDVCRLPHNDICALFSTEGVRPRGSAGVMRLSMSFRKENFLKELPCEAKLEIRISRPASSMSGYTAGIYHAEPYIHLSATPSTLEAVKDFAGACEEFHKSLVKAISGREIES